MIWRIRGRRPFARLQRDGVRVRSSPLWCTFLPDPAADPPRVAFALGRAVGPAVVRNRVRRRLREIVRGTPPPAGWYLIGGRPAVSELSFDQLRANWMALRDRIVATPDGHAPVEPATVRSSPSVGA